MVKRQSKRFRKGFENQVLKCIACQFSDTYVQKKTLVQKLWKFPNATEILSNYTTFVQNDCCEMLKLQDTENTVYITSPVNSYLGWESSLSVYVPLLLQQIASKAEWLIWTQQKQDMSSLNLNSSLQAVT